MEIILNELSLHNQYRSFDEFKDDALAQIIIFLNIPNLKILKKSDIYSKVVYQGKTLHDLMVSKDYNGKSEEMRKFKSLLAKIINDEFWDMANKKCESHSEYFHNLNNVCETGLAEAYERNSSLISFSPSNFESKTLEVSKNSVSLLLKNYTKLKDLVLFLYDNEAINFEDFCNFFFRECKLDFSQCNSAFSFDMVTDKSQESIFYNSFIMFDRTSWADILSQGGKGKNKVGFAYGRYHDQKYFSSYQIKEEIDKFRVSDKFRVFGYRKSDKFYVLEFDLTHRLSD